MSVDAPPRLAPGARRQIAVRSFVALLAPTAAVAAGCVLLLSAGNHTVGWAVAAGHLLSLGVTLSWLIGALIASEATFSRFLGTTLGLWPLRLVAVALGFGACASLGLDPIALFVAFLATHVYGHLVQAYAFSALGRASAAPEDRG